MTTRAEKIAALLDLTQSLSKIGEKPFVAEYLAVYWNGGANTKYYGSTAYSEISPFRDVKKYTSRQSIEARIMGEPFRQYELNSDLRTQNIDIELDDSDGQIRADFEAYGAAKCELFLYYSQVDLNESVWWGQILPPPIIGRFTQKTTLTNGFRAKEVFLPGRITPEECVFRYGGQLATLEQVRTSGCPYNKHLTGGTVGNLNPLTGQPYLRCPHTKAACTARLGNNNLGYPQYFGGLDLNAANIPSDSHPGNLAFSKGNATSRNLPVTWIFGTKYFRGSVVLLWARRFDQNHPDNGWVQVLFRVSEGTVRDIYNVKINDMLISTSNYAIRKGQRGQSGGYPGLESETFSSTALVFAMYGWVNPANISLSNLTLACDVLGFNEVAVYTDPDTFTRQWSDDRSFVLLEMHTNQKAGLSYDSSRFWIDKFITAATWGRKIVTFINRFVDRETPTSLVHRRTTCDVAFEGRPAVDQIADVCRSGRLSVPFQYNGKYSIEPFRAFTDAELAAAPVFYDSGDNLNIIFNGDTAVEFTQTQDDKVVNEITLTFEERDNLDIGRPIVVDDPDQKAKASKILGDASFQTVSKQYAGCGIRGLEEAVKLAYSLLWFGEFDEGGTKNNSMAIVRVPFEWTLGLTRYGPMKFSLTTMDIPSGPNGKHQVTTATAVGTATSSGNITVTVTSDGLTGSPIALTVAILNGDVATVWGPKVTAALLANTDIVDFFDITGAGAASILTSRERAADDPTMNVAIAAGTTGITAAATSADTTAGEADGPFEWYRVLGIKKIANGIGEVRAIAYNKNVYDTFEIESEDPPPGMTCSIDADCPDGYVCQAGVCVPIVIHDPPQCRLQIGSLGGDAPLDTATGLLSVPIDPCS